MFNHQCVYKIYYCVLIKNYGYVHISASQVTGVVPLPERSQSHNGPHLYSIPSRILFYTWLCECKQLRAHTHTLQPPL